ncbi:MAG: polysaccharide biosynthesis protein [Clostridia bacterium]|nr:polysaccharide biosynthesis protein [Clostridia bacterium]
MKANALKRIRWALYSYDILIFLVISALLFFVFPEIREGFPSSLFPFAIGFVSLTVARMCFKVYIQILRYAAAGYYLRLIAADLISCFLTVIYVFFFSSAPISSVLILFFVNLVFSITSRLLYQKVYQSRNKNNIIEKIALKLVKVFFGVSFLNNGNTNQQKKIAIIGAGEVGTMLAKELISNPASEYSPVCFVDSDKLKINRSIDDIPVISPTGNLKARLEDLGVAEVVIAVSNISKDKRLELYNIYRDIGFKVKTYDYPILDDNEDAMRKIHDIDMENLLFREKRHFMDAKVRSFYSGKNVMITGGGGSIGSELARQVASCGPARLTILDVYENGAYDIQQELRSIYGDKLDMRVEIVNVCDQEHVNKIFREHTPDIVIHAAAHKHVPLMERNVIEAVNNNVFGTLNVVKACETYGVKRFIMVSTDKAVNPTNVMGATKRMCEMIVQSRSGVSTSFSATRFGNVLGSNGSVVPLFKRQIAKGGPITLTDRRITRYFMTIREASQLVLTSGAMAKNGELYVLDMGEPVRILDLAESMIRLSGLTPYKDIDIVEIGLRPGEKLYEELLIKTEELDKTDNDLIFVERDKPLEKEEISRKLEILKTALASESNRVVKDALKKVVPTYHDPKEVNEK